MVLPIQSTMHDLTSSYVRVWGSGSATILWHPRVKPPNKLYLCILYSNDRTRRKAHMFDPEDLGTTHFCGSLYRLESIHVFPRVFYIGRVKALCLLYGLHKR